jgi:transcriptional regulator with XRE-family HTH domain
MNPAEVPSGEPAPARQDDLGTRIVEIRKSRGISLRQLAKLTTIPVSTLSKVQNGFASLSYHQLKKLADGLGVEFTELFTGRSVDIKTGRRAFTKAGEGLKETTERYRFELLCAELSNKRMIPGIMAISARSLEQAGGLVSHPGEEFIWVLDGTIEVITEDYRPTPMSPGDSLYLDSSSSHAYVCTGEKPARVLAVVTHMVANLAHL